METLGLILARGGSRRIPRKNVRLLDGQPLIKYTLDAARDSGCVDRLVVSTDDEEIASVATDAGAEVPFRRPPHLATDEATSHDAILHALDRLSNGGYQADVILLLQPTSPLRSRTDIRRAVALLRGRALAVVGVTEPDVHPYWCKRVDQNGRLHPLFPGVSSPSRRQELPTVYGINGAIYGAHIDYYREQDGFYGQATCAYVMPRIRSVDIDDPVDWQLAEALLRQERRS